MTHEDERYREALRDPSAVFPMPEAVLSDTSLTAIQKTEILERWRHDATQLSVAEQENMGGGEPAMLSRVVKALESVSPS